MQRAAKSRKKAPSRRLASPAAKWRLRRASGLQILEAPPLARLPWLIHGFSTRLGGTSALPPQSLQPRQNGRPASTKILNLGLTDWDTRENVAENRAAFARALGASKMCLVALRQLHSDIIQRIDANSSPTNGEPLQGDALITREKRILLAIQTADCVPILLADTKHHAVAAVHAGWRGTVRRIAAKTLGRMQMQFGTQPRDVIAALGPGIGQCCYEVGADVVKEFQAQFPAARDWFGGLFDALASNEDPNPLPWLTMRPPGHPAPEPRGQLDLIAANRSILVDAGVPPAKITSSDFCTACRTDLFFSYRREPTTGRIMAVIGVLE